ncbi:MAG: hypothetical protein A2W91_15100 [Bacteroidetes bacterium GWF2_38_335]|nr:MAG: hypothetical protein A2W91_15100 [Bacteroidetes bacterium GWF2_38_335]OFY78714.1 MAG: hypothetical protein A2281_14220 [Bacteroidetes bacterium RIFOXYA12_FULL_38_20]
MTKNITMKYKKIIKTTMVLMTLLLFSLNISAQTVVNYTTNSTFTVPAGVSQIQVECWGGGGAGGAGGGSNAQGGGGGAGGQYVKSLIAVSSGSTYNVNVGTGGTTASANGNDSWFLSNSTILAKGGQGGTAYAGGAAGGVGSTTNGIGDLIYRGGNGANGGAGLSGGGGGGAGSGGNGGNASGITSGTGTAVNGGNGGAGTIANSANGGAGSIYGGGGGGATRSGTIGSGASGYVRITYCSDVTLPAIPADPTVSLSGCTVTLTATGTPPAGVTWYWQGTSCGCSTTLGSGATYNPTASGVQYIRARDNTTGCWSLECGSVATVIQQPEIITSPTSQNGCVGSTVTFSVTATGAGLTYQWRKGGINIAGATSDSYTIASIVAGDAGNYDCVVTGTCGTATSAVATLTIITSGLTGIKTVGTAGDYTTLKAAFDAINANGLSGDLQLQIISNITETAEASLNQWTDCSGAGGYNVTIYPTGATRTISGNLATSVVTLNGADRVTIDGRLNLIGASNSLIFTNSNATTGSTIKLINDATNNTLKYISVQGAAASYTTGALFFSTASASGNNNNNIEYCSFYGSCYTGFYAEGTAGMDNKDNTVTYCNFYNASAPPSYVSGLDLEGGNTRWTITYNSFYLTSALSDLNYWPLLVNSPNGNEFIVSNNYIGGRSANCSGASLTMGTTGYILTFYGINVTVSNSGVSLIENNTIKNINFTTYPHSSGTVRFLAIASTGRIDVNDNLIGDESTGSITITINANSTYSGGVSGILKDGDGTVNNNRIGSFSINGTIPYQLLFNAIQITGTLINDVIIDGNIIGHETTANSIQSAAGATPAITFGGIYFGTGGNYKTTVSNNIVSNVTLGCTSTMPFLIGLSNQATGGTQTVIGNTISNISTASTNTTNVDMPCFAGIINNNNVTGGLSISNNSIHSITASGGAGINVYGIKGYNASGTNIINGNNIHSFTTSSATAIQKGITINTGTATVSNNMIRLGIDKNGNSVGSNATIYGIENATAGTTSVFFNSIYIGGIVAVGAASSRSYYRSGAGITDIRNNIFLNARSGGTGSHYAYYLAGIANLTSNYNIYTNGALGVLAYANLANRTTLAAIQTGTGQDANSLVTNPSFVNPTGDATAVDLHIQAGSSAIGRGIAGTGVLIDFDNQVRSIGVSPNGPCIGADERVISSGTNTYGIYASDGINGNIEDCEIFAVGGPPGGVGYQVADPANANWANVGISSYQVITASNISCTNIDLSFTTTDGSPDWLFGNGSVPTSGTASPIIAQYTSISRKDILESVKIFKDFVNITMDSPDPGSILGAPTGAGCPTTYTYTSSQAGSPGFTYYWQAIAPGGCTVTVSDPYASSTDITFVNPTGVNQVFVVSLDIETECCGPLRTVRRYITIYPGPVQPTVSGSPFTLCTGGSITLSVDAPDPSYSYEWYDALTGGTLLASGTSYNISNLPSGANSYFVQSTNSFGCSSDRTEVIVNGQDEPAPLIDNQTTCGTNDVTLFINAPGAGYTFNWYTGSCGGTIVQSGASSTYTTLVSATTNYYVSAIPSGCAASTCATVTVTYMTPPDPIVWLGVTAGTNNWYKPENWTSNCLPTCETNVSIPNLAIDPDIGFDATKEAESKNLNLQSGAVLSFSDSKSNLLICGNMTHSGIITTNDLGGVEFGSSLISQTYTRSGGTGDFNNVTINNTSASPSLTITGGNMEMGTSGSLNFMSGTIVTGTNRIIVKNTSTAAISGHNTDCYVSGNLRRYILSGSNTYVFPVGVSDRYTLAELINTGLNGVSYIDAKFISPYTMSGTLNPATAVDNTTPYLSIASEGIWQLDPNAAPTGGSYSIKLWFNDGGGTNPFTTLTDDMFGPLKRPSASTSDADWTALGGTVNAAGTPGRTVAGGYAQRTGWTTFSQYAIGIAPFPLPVELLSFKAAYNGKSVDLSWSTLSEINNDYFTIERSLDSEDFSDIGTVRSIAPGGNSSTILNYTFKDLDVKPGIYYYRLKQTDFNGDFAYSKVESVVIGESGLFSMQPNPATNEVELIYSCIENDNPLVSIYDDKLRLVFSTELSCQPGVYREVINIEHLSKGMYLVIFKSQTEMFREKLIKM